MASRTSGPTRRSLPSSERGARICTSGFQEAGTQAILCLGQFRAILRRSLVEDGARRTGGNGRYRRTAHRRFARARGRHGRGAGGLGHGPSCRGNSAACSCPAFGGRTVRALWIESTSTKKPVRCTPSRLFQNDFVSRPESPPCRPWRVWPRPRRWSRTRRARTTRASRRRAPGPPPPCRSSWACRPPWSVAPGGGRAGRKTGSSSSSLWARSA